MMKRQPIMQLSEKVCNIPEALSVYMNNVVYAMKRRGDRIYVLSLGEAYFDIPMFPFDNLDFQKGYHYSESRGLKELREKICQYYAQQYKAKVDPETEMVISAGSKPLIYMAFQAVLNPGDEVLIHEPAWLSYPEQIKLANGVPRFIPYDCEIGEFEKYITARTRMIVLNNPNNPAGRMYNKSELEKLYEICRPKGIYILIDEAYSDFVTDGSFESMAHIIPDKDGIIVLNSLSKNMGISGWRVGYAISNKDVIYNILKLNQHLITCPSTILLLYLAKYFDEICKITVPQVKEIVKKRAEVDEYIKQIGLEVLDGTATFYLFVNIGDYKYDSLELALYLLTKYHISVVPGLAYGESTGRFIRISVGVENIEDTKKVLNRIKSVIDHNEYDSDIIDKELKKIGMNRFVKE